MAAIAYTAYPLTGALTGTSYIPLPDPWEGMLFFAPMDGDLNRYDAESILVFSRAPQRPPRSLGFAQADVRSGGGERIGRDYYAKDDLIPLDWPSMPGADKNALLDFWQDQARGMANGFTYTDIEDNSATCRFATPRLPEIRERAYDTFVVHVQLRVV